MTRHAYRTELGDDFSEGARQLWLRVTADFEGKQGALATDLGADAGLVSRWLYGDRKPGLDWALKLASRYAIDPALWGKPPAKPFTPPGEKAARGKAA